MKGIKLIIQLLSTDNKLFYNKHESINAHNRIDIDKPLWDQNTYYGRWRHFAFISDIRTVFVSEKQLWKAKELCELYKQGKESHDVTESDIRWAKKLRDSSFNFETGEPLNLIGRLSFQVPGNIFVTTGMLTYYKTSRSMIAWQVLNQAFNAIVNYTNRPPTSRMPRDIEIIKQAFIGATFASCAVAIGFNHFFASRGAPVAKWSPFFAVAAGNSVNLPIMRRREIEKGIPLFYNDSKRSEVINSRIAAVKAIGECTLSRIIIAAPGMLLIPVLMKKIKIQTFYQRRPWIESPIEAMLVKIFLIFMIPSALAIYPEIYSLNTNILKICQREYEEYKAVFTDMPARLYYYKGL